MKQLVKVFVAAALCLCVSGAINAQIKLGLSPGIQLPLGDFGDAVNLGFGGGISGEYLVTENIGVGLNVGYFTFSGKDLPAGYKDSYSIIPITLDGKYYFMTEGFKPYGGLDLGLYMLGNKWETPEENLGFGVVIPAESKSETKSYFGFAPVVGVQYDLTDNLALDLNLKYNYVLSGEKVEGEKTPDFTSFGINVGIVYTIGK